jgi:hypothetical protein
MLQFAEADQPLYYHGRILEWLGGGLEIACAYR